MHLHVAGDVQILSSVQILNIKHTSLVVNGPRMLLGIQNQEGHFPKHEATSAELGSDGSFQSRAKQLVLERWWGRSAVYWEALCCVDIVRGKGMGNHRSAHDCPLLLAEASWRGLFGVQLLLSVIASPSPSHLWWWLRDGHCSSAMGECRREIKILTSCILTQK